MQFKRLIKGDGDSADWLKNGRFSVGELGLYYHQKLDELSLVKGSRVMILEKSGDGWWRGQYGNKVNNLQGDHKS